jgi:hypothetical protein
MVEQWGYAKGGVHLTNNTPVFMEMDIGGSPTDAANTILSVSNSGSVSFVVYRGVLQVHFP